MVNRIVGFDAAKRLVFGNPDLLVPGPPHQTPVGGVKSRELLPTMTKFMCPSSHSKEDSNYPNSKKKEQSDTFSSLSRDYALLTSFIALRDFKIPFPRRYYS